MFAKVIQAIEHWLADPNTIHVYVDMQARSVYVTPITHLPNVVINSIFEDLFGLGGKARVVEYSISPKRKDTTLFYHVLREKVIQGSTYTPSHLKCKRRQQYEHTEGYNFY